jgi:large subunit ribosomal protein L25
MVAIVSVKKREKLGSRAARAYRHQGYVPANIYGLKQPSNAILMLQKELLEALKTPGFLSRVVQMDAGDGPQMVIAKALQRNPVTDQVVHVEWLRVDDQSTLHIQVPIHYTNENQAPGIKLGGVLNVIVHRLDVLCSPRSIPEGFTIDLTGKQVGQSISLDALQLPDGVRPFDAIRDHVLATIVAPGGAEASTGTSEAVTAS